jgi:hypothetical protein
VAPVAVPPLTAEIGPGASSTFCTTPVPGRYAAFCGTIGAALEIVLGAGEGLELQAISVAAASMESGSASLVICVLQW